MKKEGHSLYYIFYFMLLLLVCLPVIFATTGVTYAWFYLNASVTERVNGMNAKVIPNLIISLDASKMATLKADSVGVSEVSMKSTVTAFTPVTHYGVNASNQPVTFDNLKCLSDNTGVNRLTGFYTSGSLIDLPTGDGKTYYVDYTVYIASTDTTFTNCALSVALNASTHDVGDTLSYQAASVDFYLGDVATGTFIGTLNQAGLDARLNDGVTAKRTLTIEIPDDTVPLNTEGYITVTMRCYFDGALKTPYQDDYRCFVNSATVSTSDVSFGVTFSKIAPPTS